MPSNVHYKGPEDMPEVIPVFPLAGALLLPRGHIPLNIFEPRYLAMVDHALAGHRLIGLIQPESDADTATAPPLYRVGCVGRLTEVAETGDGRYIITLTGVARFRIVEEQAVLTPFRQCRVDFLPYARDFVPRLGEAEVDRTALLNALRAFSEAKSIEIDWDGVSEAPNEALVNALAMMSPYGVREKQALLEAPDLKSRSELLVAITEIELSRDSGDTDITVQ